MAKQKTTGGAFDIQPDDATKIIVFEGEEKSVEEMKTIYNIFFESAEPQLIDLCEQIKLAINE